MSRNGINSAGTFSRTQRVRSSRQCLTLIVRRSRRAGWLARLRSAFARRTARPSSFSFRSGSGIGASFGVSFVIGILLGSWGVIFRTAPSVAGDPSTRPSRRRGRGRPAPGPPATGSPRGRSTPPRAGRRWSGSSLPHAAGPATPVASRCGCRGPAGRGRSRPGGASSAGGRAWSRLISFVVFRIRRIFDVRTEPFLGDQVLQHERCDGDCAERPDCLGVGDLAGVLPGFLLDPEPPPALLAAVPVHVPTRVVVVKGQFAAPLDLPAGITDTPRLFHDRPPSARSVPGR